jgi:hypothetical protein
MFVNSVACMGGFGRDEIAAVERWCVGRFNLRAPHDKVAANGMPIGLSVPLFHMTGKILGITGPVIPLLLTCFAPVIH